MEHAKRFSALLADLGLKHLDAAKLLHVSLRTLQNWLSARHEVPYASYKLLRLLRYRELPGDTWRGWSFTRGHLVTPEGRTISGKDGAWWSLLVRRSYGFGELYQQARIDRHIAEQEAADASGSGRVAARPDAGLVPFKTTLETSLLSWGQNGAIIEPWPTILDFPPLSMPMPENAVNALESALTPCSVSPSMPTCGNPNSQRPEVLQPPQALPQSSKAVQPSIPAIPGLRLTPLTVRLQLVNPSSSPSLNDGNLPDNSAKSANSDGFEAVKAAA